MSHECRAAQRSRSSNLRSWRDSGTIETPNSICAVILRAMIFRAPGAERKRVMPATQCERCNERARSLRRRLRHAFAAIAVTTILPLVDIRAEDTAWRGALLPVGLH